MNGLNEIKGMVNKIKKLDETVCFEEDFGNNEELPVEDEPVHAEEDTVEKFDEFEETENAVAKIRKIALEGMIKLCETPENEEYQTLKKIFQFCDKTTEQKNVVAEPEK